MSMLIRSILFFCFIHLIICSVSINAQNYALRHYDSNNGLPSSDVFHAIQDSKGYIWFATDNGVSRFNGYEFTNYDISDGLPQNTILEIYEDFKGRIWFISLSAKLSWFEHGKITPFKYNEILSQELKTKPIPLKSSFYVDSLNTIYMGIKGFGIVSVNSGGQIQRLKINDLNPYQSRIFEFAKNKLLLSYHTNFATDSLYYCKQNVNIPLFLKDSPKEFLQHGFATKLNDHRIVLALKRIIFEINNYIEVKRHVYPFPMHWMSQDNQKNIWICGANKGAWRYKNGNFDGPPDIKLLEAYSVSSVLQDNKNGYWFTTLYNGIYYLPTLSTYYYDNAIGLLNNNINFAKKHNDSIWITYHSNLLSLKTPNQIKNFKLSSDKNMEISKLIFDTLNNRTVIGSTKHLYFIKSGQVITIKNNHEKLSGKNKNRFNVKDIISDRKGGYWIAGGIGFFHWRNGKTDFDSNYDKNFHLRVNSIWLDNENTVWLGTINGLWKYQNKYLHYLGRKNDLFRYRVLDIVSYKKNIVIGTKGAGILILHPDSIIQITNKDGLSSNTITSMAASGEFLWAGTKKGLNKIEFIPKQNNSIKISKYTKAHGLPTNEIREVESADSLLLLSTNQGLTIFNTNEIIKDTIPLPIYITDIQINNNKVSSSNYHNLNYDENNIFVKYEAISFKNKNDILYKYQLIGLDTTWTYTKNNTLRFSFLPPGEYKFLLNVMNPDEIWNPEPLQLNFKIKKPFWRTFIFIFLSIVAFLAIVFFMFKYRLDEIKKKTVLEKELNKYINQALVNQMNPHFLFNALNSINNYILKNDKMLASKYLTKFSSLMRIILENTSKEYIPIFEEIKANKLYLDIESSRLENELNYEFTLDDSIDQFSIKIPSLLLQPFLENAIWHGIQPSNKKGYIKVSITKKKVFLQIEIQDNGIGRKKALELKNKSKTKKLSLGIEISQKRIKLLERLYQKGVNIEYEDLYDNELATGTRVRINIPIIS